MHKGKNRFVAGFLIGPLGLYVVFMIWPYVQTFGYSFTNWRGQSSRMEFVGLQNYADLFSDSVFLRALWNNFLLLVSLPLATILLALFFAFMVNVGGRGGAAGIQGVRGSGFYKVVFFLPHVLSVVILAILWRAIYRGDIAGLINGTLVKAGISDPEHPIEWLNSPNLVLWCVAFVLLWWGVGFYLVLFSAAMQSIPKDIYEAALLDGASRVQTFFRVTLPLLWDTVQTAWVYLAILAMDGFALISVMTPGSNFGGGPDHSSEVMATYLMRNFLAFGKSGYACAMGVVILVLTLILSVVTLRISRREHIEY
ncbi:carbohydrate ABC transporter permease [Streptomyces sp. GC420]|uniref:carbohydrate ABC transporter permease n=1 Tax=Streptomyces sp. GC420 TaxID=2697568 RepID=UPI00141515FF|nr:sugar ABC transporter permease [Streptomyces sp. GC420]NBM14652.1 ABC transporter permease subunit [Streptomyces sp. GC420]